MKHGEAPWVLMWSSPLLFAFGMFWAWVVEISFASTVTALDMPVRSALLVAAGVLGTLLGQSGVLWAWRRYVRAAEDVASRPESDVVGHAVPSAETGEAQHPKPPSSP